jgi:WD40 repeat protein
LISGSADKTIKIWHLESETLLHTLNLHSEAVNSVAINVDGNLLCSGSDDKTIKIWRPDSGELLYTLSEHSASVTCVAIANHCCKQQLASKATASHLTIASGSQDKTIKIWQFE